MYKHILAATDFSVPGGRALEKAARLAVELGAKLTLVHVRISEETASPLYAEHEVRALLSRLEEEHAKTKAPGVHVELQVEVRTGNAAQEILAAATEKQADLIVLGPSSHSGMARWLLGSTSDTVVQSVMGRDVLIVV